MTIDLPSYETDHLADGSTPNNLIRKPEAIFHWPPDCLWPFVDDALMADT
jgi:hypothetical protein